MQTGEVFDDTYDKLIMATGSSVIVCHQLWVSIMRKYYCAKNYEQAEPYFINLYRPTNALQLLGPDIWGPS
nr:hypothetical protein [Lactiplantibacillus plantarum]